jgi:hypothetical protein
MTTFNIGNQNAANIQNIGGDAHFYGDVNASTKQHIDLRGAIARVHHETAGLALPSPVRTQVDGALSAAAEEAARDEPDRSRVADFLGSAAQALKDAGAIGAAGSTLVDAFRQAAALIGPLGQAAVAFL